MIRRSMLAILVFLLAAAAVYASDASSASVTITVPASAEGDMTWDEFNRKAAEAGARRFAAADPFGYSEVLPGTRRTGFTPDMGNTTSFSVKGIPMEAAFPADRMVIIYPSESDSDAVENALIGLVEAMDINSSYIIIGRTAGMAEIMYPAGWNPEKASDALWSALISGKVVL